MTGSQERSVPPCPEGPGVKESRGRIEIIDPSERGLGHLLDPLANEDNPKEWIERVWKYIVASALLLPVPKLDFLSVPALSRLSITSPQVLRPIAATQSELPFDERTRPTNFLLSASIAEHGHPVGTDVHRFHLVSQYNSDPKKALTEKWTDIHSGHQYDVTTDFPAPPYVARIRTFGSVLGRFLSHPEPKSAAADGRPSNRHTVGLLQRRHVSVGSIMYVGKETNRLEDVDNGLVHDWSEVYSVYKNPAHKVCGTQSRLGDSDTKTSPGNVCRECRSTSTLDPFPRRTFRRRPEGAAPAHAWQHLHPRA